MERNAIESTRGTLQADVGAGRSAGVERASEEMLNHASRIEQEMENLANRLSSLVMRLRGPRPEPVATSPLSPPVPSGFVGEMRGRLVATDKTVDAAHKLMAEIEGLI